MTDTPMTPERERMIRMSRTHCEAVNTETTFQAEGERPLHVWGPSQHPAREMCQLCTVLRTWAEDPDADEVLLLAEVDRLRKALSEAAVESSAALSAMQERAGRWEANWRTERRMRLEGDTKLRSRDAEVEAAESRLTAVELLVEEARDKDNHSVDTDLLLDALGLEN